MKHIKAYAQLLRLPNVFTACADIFLGWLAVSAQGSVLPFSSLWLLLLSSACLYSAGMVLNDFFDVEQDRQERPFRPIPSGRIARGTAGFLGCGLLLLGLGATWMAGENSFFVAVILGGCILAYDGGVKRTWLGPLVMGSCRFLNVLLGCSAGSAFLAGWMIHLAAIVGIYIVGVTLFARSEAGKSKKAVLWSAVGVMAAASVLAVILPVVWWGTSDRWEWIVFPYALIGWVLFLALPIQRALEQPEPSNVQAAVKRSIFGLIVLDAILAFALYGSTGLLILLLLVPAVILGRFVYST
jgi:4-hydroxybenzoate polyprenyltransferase